jgi:hydroxycarboxylate dehydrogenase B
VEDAALPDPRLPDLHQIPPEDLHRFTVGICTAMGSEAEEARIVADHLVLANLSGHDSHGVGMLPTYHASWMAGALVPNRTGRILSAEGAILAVDGEMGYGQVVALKATERAIDTARRHGVCVLSLSNAHHIGRIGNYSEVAVAAGLVSVQFCNVLSTRAYVAAHGGRDARLGTNPVSVGVPATADADPFLLDMATSATAFGKIRVAHNKGVPVDPSLIIDAAGHDTTDPHALFTDPPGALLPMAAHKGYGMAVAAELLAGALSGQGTMATRDLGDGVVNALFAVLVDPSRLPGGAGLTAETTRLSAYLKGAPPRDPAQPVLMAGDPERETRRVRATAVPVDAGTLTQLEATADALGVALPWRSR